MIEIWIKPHKNQSRQNYNEVNWDLTVFLYFCQHSDTFQKFILFD